MGYTQDRRDLLRGIVVLVAIATTIAAVPAPLAAGQGGSGDLQLEVSSWCPPQIAGCLPADDPCGPVSQPGRELGAKVEVTRGGAPVSFARLEVQDGDPNTAYTGSDGTARLSLDPAEDVHIVAHDGDESTELALPTFWGEIAVPSTTVSATVGPNATVPFPFSFDGLGTGPTIPVTFNLEHPGGGMFSSQAAPGDPLPITETEATERTYSVVDAVVCGLAPDAQAEITVDWAPAALDSLALDCASPVPGGTTSTCTATAHDRFGNERPDEPDIWNATRGFFEDPSGSSVDLVTPRHGGNVTVTASIGAISDTAIVRAFDAGPPSLTVLPPDEVRAGQPATFQIEASDPGGLSEVALVQGGRVAASQVVAGENASIELVHTFRQSGTHQITGRATDTAGNVREATVSLPVGLPPEGPQRSGGTGSSSPTTSTPATDGPDGSDASEDGDGTSAPGTSPPAEVTAEQETMTDGTVVHRATVNARHGSAPTVVTRDGSLSLTIATPFVGTLDVTMGTTPAPSSIPEPIYPVAEHMDLSAQTSGGDQVPIDDARITFTLSPERLEQAEASPEEVVLLHWNGDYWARLETTHLGQEAGMHRFEATTTGLSPFAIALTGSASDGDGSNDGDEATTEPIIEVLATKTTTDRGARYEATVVPATGEQTVRVRGPDGAFTLELPAPSTDALEIRLDILDASPERAPEALTDVGRYIELDVRDANGQPIEPVGAVLRLSQDAASLGTGEDTGENLVLVHEADDGWEPTLDAREVSGETATFTVPQPSTRLYAIVLDTTAPRIGLEQAPPEPVEPPHIFTAVASDDVGVREVRLEMGGEILDTATQHPFELTIEPEHLEEGLNEVTFVVEDHAGNTGQSTWSLTAGTDEPLTPAEEEGAQGDETGEQAGSGGPVDWLTISLVLLAIAVIAGASVVYVRVRSTLDESG